MIDIEEKKKKIISFLEANGPSIPVRIAKAIDMDPVFASAISSELLESKQIKTSHMKIGSSPLYFIPGQEQKLEKHTENLKSIEKDAYLKLREKKTIKDEDEPPAIRVALRNIKDFAIPFKSEEKIMWKYAFAPEEKITDKRSDPTPTSEATDKATAAPLVKDEAEVPKAWEVKKEEIEEAKKESKKIENIFQEKKTKTKQTFLEQIEEFLKNKNRKILSIEEVDKKRVIAKIELENKTAFLFAFNKKKITEDELIKCYKKARESNLPYNIITTGEPTKKMTETIDAYKKLIKLEKLDES